MLKAISIAALATIVACLIAAAIAPKQAKSFEECAVLIQPGEEWPDGC